MRGDIDIASTAIMDPTPADTAATAAAVTGSSRAQRHKKIIGFVSDIEGNYEYWRNYLQISYVVREATEAGDALRATATIVDGAGEDEGLPRRLVLREGCHLVYGGDVCDRGPGDLRVMRDILMLKESYPDRVHIILGNRDINKLRLPFELSSHTRAQTGKVYWIRGSKPEDNCTAAAKLLWMLRQTMGCPDTFELRRRELADLRRRSPQEAGAGEVTDEEVVQSFLDILKPDGLLTRYLLNGQIGAVIGDALFIHGGLNEHNIGWVPPTAAEVRVSCGPDRAGLSSAAPLPPSRYEAGRRVVGSIRDWVDALNAFAKTEVSDFMKDSEVYLSEMALGYLDEPTPPGSPVSTPTAESKRASSVSEHEEAGARTRGGGAYWALSGWYDHPQPGSRLLQYGMGWTPDQSKNPTVIYESWLDESGKPCTPSPAVSQRLHEAGIHFVATGHQPHGDAPLVLASSDVVYISADTSYSANVQWDDERDLSANLRASGGDAAAASSSRGDEEADMRMRFIPCYQSVRDAGSTRGIAVSEVCFELSDRGDSVQFAFSHGVLSNGREYAMALPSATAAIDGGGVASKTDKEWWVKGRLLDAAELPHTQAADTPLLPRYLVSRSQKYSVTNKVAEEDA